MVCNRVVWKPEHGLSRCAYEKQGVFSLASGMELRNNQILTIYLALGAH